MKSAVTWQTSFFFCSIPSQRMCSTEAKHQTHCREIMVKMKPYEASDEKIVDDDKLQDSAIVSWTLTWL